MRPVIRTYSAPLPLTNPAFFQPQPNQASAGMPSMSSEPYAIPPTDQEMFNIKHQIRNNIVQKSKVSKKNP